MIWEESLPPLPYLQAASLNKPSKDSLNIIGRIGEIFFLM